MSVISRGYLTISDDLVRMEPVTVEVGGSATDMGPGAHLDDWSYYLPFTVRTSIRINAAEARTAMLLPAAARFCALLRWTAGGTSLRGGSAVVELDEDEIALEVEIEEGQIRRRLEVTCTIVLRETPEGALEAIAPRGAGTLLWETNVAIDLEGVAPRLPVVAIPFSTQGPKLTGAMWWLQIPDDGVDLDSAADSTLWMWLNTENPVIAALLDNASGEVSSSVAEFMCLDLQRQMVELALRIDDLDPSHEYPPGSLGEQLLVSVLAVAEDLDSLRSLQQSSPGDFEVRIQAAFGEDSK